MRRVARCLALTLRLSAVATLALSLWLLWQTPVAQYFRAATVPEVRLAIDRLSGRDFDQAWLDSTVSEALEASPIDWPLIESAQALGAGRGLGLSPAVADDLRGARAQQSTVQARAANCVACAAGDASCEMSGDGLACALGIELTPIGDIRVLLREGQAYARNQPVDDVSVALASVGLGATAAILISGGGSAAIKGGIALTRIARRAGHLTPALMARLSRLGARAIDWNKMPKTAAQALDPKAYRAAIRGGVLAAGASLFTDLDRMRQAVPAPQAFRLLRQIDTARDARRMALLTEGAGVRSLAIVQRIGKSRAFRLTIRLSRVGRTLVGLAIALGVQALALVMFRLQTGLARGLSRLAAR